MNGTKLLLIAASTIAIAACGGAEVEEDMAVADGDADRYAEAEAYDEDTELGAETLVEPEQPPLEGDSPFVDSQDVAQSRLDQENYDSGFDGTDLRDGEAGLGLEDEGFDIAEDDDVSGYGIDDEIDTSAMDQDEIVGATPNGETGLMDDEVETAANIGGQDRAEGMQSGQADQGIPAGQRTVRETDARIVDGALITGSEAALLSGTYEVEIAGLDDSRMLYIDGRGDRAAGTFGGEPMTVSVTGRNFQFDAPVMMDGEEQLMTFTGTVEEGGLIDNGVVSAEGGDGSTMTFTADRIENAERLGPDDMAGDR